MWVQITLRDNFFNKIIRALFSFFRGGSCPDTVIKFILVSFKIFHHLFPDNVHVGDVSVFFFYLVHFSLHDGEVLLHNLLGSHLEVETDRDGPSVVLPDRLVFVESFYVLFHILMGFYVLDHYLFMLFMRFYSISLKIEVW